jgi:hypothetical protein
MRAAKYFFALWVGIGINALLSITYGTAGFSAYRQLEAERDKQKSNLETLARINKDLENEMDGLRYDRDTLIIHARDLGFAAAGERFIRIVGLGGVKKPRTEPGQVYAAAIPEYVPQKTITIIAFCAGFAVFICMAVFDFLRYLQER